MTRKSGACTFSEIMWFTTEACVSVNRIRLDVDRRPDFCSGAWRRPGGGTTSPRLIRRLRGRVGSSNFARFPRPLDPPPQARVQASDLIGHPSANRPAESAQRCAAREPSTWALLALGFIRWPASDIPHAPRRAREKGRRRLTRYAAKAETIQAQLATAAVAAALVNPMLTDGGISRMLPSEPRPTREENP